MHKQLLNANGSAPPSNMGRAQTAIGTQLRRCRTLRTPIRSMGGLIMLLLLLLGSNAQGTHYAGGQITYEWVAGTVYRVTKTIYRDCGGASIGASSTLRVNSLAGNQSYSLPRTSVTDITPLCPGQVSRCQSAAGTVGIEEHVFVSNISFLPLPPGNFYTLSSVLCCRNNAITTLSNPGGDRLYLETLLNPGFVPGNSSPEFLNIPVAFLCANQPATISPNAFDPDGDAIQYSLTACRSLNSTNNVSYGPGFSPTNPLTTTAANPVTIDASTGLLSFTPSVPQVGVICFLAEEFRNGVKIGQIVRDIQVQVTACNNAPPVVAPITNYFIPVGQQLCVPVSATDADNDNITLTATGGIIPPATFVQNTNNPGSATGTFCFTPGLANAGQTYTITINAQDDACPSPGSGVETFNITVPIPCNMAVEATGTNPSCPGVADGTAMVSIINGTAPYNYTWSGPNGFSSSSASLSGLQAGTYCVVVQDGNSCVDSSCVTLVSSGSPIQVTTTVVGANCGLSNGSITASASGGVAPYTFSINGGSAQASGTFNGLGQGTYTIEVTDNNGCTSTATASVGQAADVTAPVITCPANISVSNDQGLCGAVVSFSATATDDCGTPVVVQTGGNASGTLFPVGTTTVTFTATDGASNTATCSFTVTVNDTEAPNAVCQAATAALDSNGNASITAADVNGGSTDNCGIASISVSPSSFGCADVGQNQVTLTVTDVNGNSSTCMATVTVEDNISPTAQCQNITVALGPTGQVTITPQQINAGSFDNCGIGSAKVDPTVVTCADFGQTVTATLTVTDPSGNVSTCTGQVTVQDTTAPTVQCPPGANYDCLGNIPAPDPSLVVATDNCLPLVYLYVGDTDNGASGCPGSPLIVTRTYLVEDPTHNQTSCTQVFTVEDTVAPVVTCPADVTLQCGPNLDTSPAATGTATGSDNCGANTNQGPNCWGPTTLSLADNSGSTTINYCGPFGCQGVQGTWGSVTATQTSTDMTFDVSMNIDWRVEILDYKAAPESQFTPDGNGVWIVDNTWSTTIYPTPSGPQQASFTFTLPADSCFAVGARLRIYKRNFLGQVDVASVRTVWLYDPAYTLRNNPPASPFLLGHCFTPCNTPNAVPVTYSDVVTPGCGGTSTITRTWTATDECNNMSSCDQIITIEDNTAPVISCPANITVDNDPGVCGAAVNFAATATDGCSAVTLTYSTSPGSVFAIGTTSVTATATDACNNTSSCTFDVTVNDTEAPNAVCQNVTVQLDATGNASITASNVDGGSTDNCAIASISATPTAFTCGDVGNNAVTLTVTDVNGNVSTCAATVTVEDNVAPNAVCQNVTVQLDANGNASIIAADIDGGSTDNCGIQTISVNPASFNCSNVGGNTVTLTVKDVNLNTSTCTATVTILDNVAPTALCQNVTVQLDAGGNASITAADVDGGSSDNCGPVTLSANPTAFTCANVGGNTVTLTVTDANNNVSTCTATVTVEDNIAPDAICQNIGVTLDANGNASITASDVDGGSSDNCAIASITANPTAFTCANVGANTVTLTVTDVNNNVSTCTATVMVMDNMAPNAICQNVTVQLDANGNASITAADVDGGSNDNCGIQSISANPTSFTCADAGANTVTLTVTDVNNNVSTCTATVTVEDVIAPSAVCQSVTVQLDANGNASIVAADIDGGSNDNCGIQSISANPTSFGCANVGGNTVTLTVTDLSNNVSTCTATVTVEDNIAPNAVCQNITVQLDANGNASIVAADVDGGSNDNCGIASLSATPTSFDCANTGGNTVTLTVTDVNNNVSTCTATVTVEDNINPMITCPANVTVGCVVNVPAADPSTATASDNCPGVTVAHTSDTDNGGSGCAGDPLIIMRTYTATDASGNTASCVQVLTSEATPIVTTTSPNAIVFPAYADSSCADISVAATGGCPGYTYLWSNGATTSMQNVCPTVSTVYTVTVTDAQGCTKLDSVKVCVVDLTCVGGTNNGPKGNGQGGQGSTNGNAPAHIYVCHIPPGNPNNAMTKCLPPSAVRSHLSQGHGGDHLGPCGSLASRACDFNSNNKIAAASSAAAAVDAVPTVEAFPNPFSTTTHIRYSAVQDEEITVAVYSLAGKKVVELGSHAVNAGAAYEMDWNAEGVTAGMYILHIKNTSGQSFTHKLMLSK